MTRLDITLITVGLVGAAMLYLVFTQKVTWNWSRYGNAPDKELGKSAPFALGLLTVLSLAAIVFSIHALLFVHGILKW